MILPQLQEALVVASDAAVARRRRRSQRFRLGLMTSAAVVTLGGGAVASQSVWAPLLGWEDGNRPTATADPAPADQRALLGVLRREQTAADRGSAGQDALRSLSRRYAGVRVGDLRVIAPPSGGVPTVLVPVEAVARPATADARPATAEAPSRADALCVRTRSATPAIEGADQRCFTTAAVRSSRAVFLIGTDLRGLVPDAVARVRFDVSGTAPYEVSVRDNLFVADLDRIPRGARMTWLDAAERPVPFADGTRTRAVDEVPFRAEIPRSFHDCGRAQGGVVPQRIRCGPAARAYVPAKGAVQYLSQKP